MKYVFGKSFATAITGAAFCLTAGLASAADLPPPPATKYVPPPAPVYKDAPPPVHSYDWSGPYIGAHIGWGFADVDWDVGPGTPTDIDTDGFIGGGLLGYNFQAGNFVFGIEGDVSFGDIDGSALPGGPPAVQSEIDFMATIRGRVGLAMDNVLFFVTGGIAFADHDANDPGSAAPMSDSQSHTGYTLGAGIDWAFTRHMIGRIEYQYADFDDETYTIGGAPEGIEFDTHVVRIALMWKFW